MIVLHLAALLVALDTAESMFVAQCVEAIGNANFRKRTISVFYSPKEAQAIVEFGLLRNERGAPLDASITALMTSWTVQIFSDQAKALPAQKQKRSPHEAVLIFLENTATFEHIVRVAKTNRVLGSKTKVLVYFESDSGFDVSETLQYVWDKLRAINAYVCAYNETAIRVFQLDLVGNVTFSKVQHTAIDPSDCRKVSFPNEIKNIAPLLPIKLVGEKEDEPYLYYHPRNNRPDGLCIRTFNFIAQLLNSKLRVKIFDDYGDAYSGHEHTGLFGELYRYEADIICGNCMLYDHRLEGFEVLSLFQREQYVYIMAKPPAIVTGSTLQGLVIEFSESVWICFTAVWISTALVLYFYQYSSEGRSELTPLLIGVFGSTFGNTIAGLKDSLRIFVWMILLYNIVITSSYTSGLIGHLAVPRNGKMFKSYEEAEASGLSRFPGRVTSQMLKSLESNRSMYGTAMKKVADVWIMRNFTKCDQSAVFYFTEIPKGPPEPNFWFMSPAHPLLPIIESQIGAITQAGLLDYWLREIHFGELLTSIYDKCRNSEGSPSKQITLDHMSGAFVLYLLCILLSTVAFAFEILSQ